VFKAVVESGRRFTRAITGAEPPLAPAARELGNLVAQAMIAGRFGDILELATPALRARTDPQRFVELWRTAVTERGGLIGYDLDDLGEIDLHFIPGLEDVPQEQFAAFLEIAFSTPTVAFVDENAFAIGVVVLDDGERLGVGAIHAR
jgi:hypothetical protein